MDVEVNCKSADDRVYLLAKTYRLSKTYIVVSWRAYCKMLYTHWPVTIPVASQNPMNAGNVEKEGRNGREVSNR